MRSVLVAALAGAVLVAGCADGPAAETAADTGDGVGELLRPLEGVAQDGIVLGDPDAPRTITAYVAVGSVDVRLNQALPDLVERAVRPGRASLQLRTVSETEAAKAEGAELGARALQAAGLQDRLWHLYRVMSAAHLGFLDSEQVDAMVAAVPGLDAAQVARDAGTPRITRAIDRADAYARRARVTDPPAVTVTRADGSARRIRWETADGLVRAVMRALDAPR